MSNSCCLCGKEKNAAKRLDQCYPVDDRPDPNLPRVNELVSWGSHDVSNLDYVYDLLSERLKRDIHAKNVNRTSVGMQILEQLISQIEEIRPKVSPILVDHTILVIKKQTPPFLNIADKAAPYIIKYSREIQLKSSITNIVKQYLSLIKEPKVSEHAYESLANIIQQAPIQTLPIKNILFAIKNDINTSEGARSLIVAMGRNLNQVTSLSSFFDVLFDFFTENKIWNNPEVVEAIMKTLINEMKEKLSPPFFKLWIQKLPPKSPDTGNSDKIINISNDLFDSIPPDRLLSSNEVDPLITVFYFVLQLPSLEYNDKKEIEEKSFQLSQKIAGYYSNYEIIEVAHHQLWINLPTGEEQSTDYNVTQITTVFKFNTMIDHAIEQKLTKKLIKEGLKRIVKFLIYFKKHHKEIFIVILKYLKSLEKLLPNMVVHTVIPMLLALQKETKNAKDVQQLTLHTLVMCAMHDAVADAPKGARKYVASVIKDRLNADPVQADTKVAFFKSYFPDYKKSKKDKKEDKNSKTKRKDKDEEENENSNEDDSFYYFDKESIMNNYKDLKSVSSVFRAISEITMQTTEDDYDEEDENASDDESDDNAPKMVIFKTGESGSDTADDNDVDEKSESMSESKKEKEREKAYDFIDNISFNNDNNDS